MVVGGRRQEAGGRRQEVGGRRQKAGGRRQEVQFFTELCGFKSPSKNVITKEHLSFANTP
jgi:hypothetical protein